MSLATNIQSAFTATGTAIKATRTTIGSLPSLTTAAKNDLVSAINEINAKPSGTGGAAIADGDAGTATTTTYSASKITALINAAKTVISDTASATTTVYSSSKVVSLLAAKAEINDSAASSAAVFSSTKVNASILALINDAAAGGTTTYSSTKINAAIQAAVANLVNSAPAALDTLAELSTALGGDAAFATTVTTALGNRVRFDASQTLTSGQQTQARTNIAAAGSTEVGDTTTDFVATFNAGLV